MTFKEFASKEAACKRVLRANDRPDEKAKADLMTGQPAAQPETSPKDIAPAAKP